MEKIKVSKRGKNCVILISTFTEATQERIVSLEAELARLKSQIAQYTLTQMEDNEGTHILTLSSQCYGQCTVLPPPPPPPAPPPPPLPQSTSVSHIDFSTHY